MKTSMDPINLFWTGGWDSTFRLLKILMNERKPVQTYYIIDPNRTSFHIEMQTMEKIRKDILKQYPFVHNYFLPTDISHLSDIEPDLTIEKAYQRANKKEHLGSQYNWLARYCKQHQINNMELCIQKQDTPDHPPRFSPYFNKDDKTEKFVYKKSLKNEPEYLLFKYFRFPILDLTKDAIFDTAKQNDWWGIMRKTWFCHEPIWGRIPCGKCAPCQQIINDEIMKKRIPFYIRRIRKNPSSKISKLFDMLFISR
jgi:7-cyano-7-deazaguanine synthase in queuosine biosynthesis